jgi:hypothetical protein
MKERPILMTPENAQKCHDGRKTQTRRIIKGIGHESKTSECPYGKPGDRLWVREPHQLVPSTAYQASKNVDHRASPCGCYWVVYKGQWDRSAPGCWKPSLYMPRWACRTVLEITEVRVQRLQDITVEDVLGEGGTLSTTSSWYARLWESINGYGSWEANPWVWALTFTKVMEDPE